MASQDLVGAPEIAAILGMTRQGVNKLARTNADFPQPVAVLSANRRVWRRVDIERWARDTGRLA